MRVRNYPTKKCGAYAAKVLGDKRLAKVFYLRPSANGAKYGPCGLMLDHDSACGAEYGARACVCGQPLGYGPLTLYSDGNSPVALVHQLCARRAIQWARVNDYTDLRVRVAPAPENVADAA